jgi:hypothetical protein
MKPFKERGLRRDELWIGEVSRPNELRLIGVELGLESIDPNKLAPNVSIPRLNRIADNVVEAPGRRRLNGDPLEDGL